MTEPQADLENIRTVVKQFIMQEFLPGVAAEELTEATPLASDGILDSLATVRLVAMLEERFSIDIQPHEVSIDHLNTLDSIAQFVLSKA